ncbi:MAG TPA: septal ring lytic transglycosylase RlpA family protein [Solirubrobacterales bacterium]|nr:septal ring lytic transglycosylase RlpA family protein [Solirubrobacterales bacterium]
MDDSPYRHARKTNLPTAPVPGWIALWLRAAVLAAALALAVVPGAQAATGGAASAAPVPTEATETTTAFNAAELSFTPYRYAGASWYGGISMWGRSTACGQTLRPSTIGVANKTLPCGTPVKFVWHGHSIVAPVIDRGPYIKGRAWDLTSAAAEALEFEGVGRIRYAVAIEYASKGL